ncbi:MAG: SMP-30/gluconolactonase/LRE family protein [Bacteroidota bacterium]
MNNLIYTLSFLLIFLASMGLYAQDQNFPNSKIIAKGATVKQLSSEYSFTEGPAVDPQGNVFFTDQPNNRILKWATDGSLSVYMEEAGRSNGLYFDHEGNLLSCADEKNQLWKISPDKKVEVLIDDFEGKKLNGPNDLWVDPKGGIYFTDPFYKRPWWDREEKEIEEEKVYYLSPDKKSLRAVATDFKRPNGIVGSKDGRKLYVADIGANKTYVFDIDEDANLSNRKLFTDLGSDGMTLDHKGNLYLTGKGVSVFNKQGKQIGHIPIEEGWTANVCFGGKDQKTLFITAMKSLYSLEMKVKGIR